jgi:hypothetical protein
MTHTSMAIGAAAIIVIVFIAVYIRRHRPRKLNNKRLNTRWTELQARCADKTEWHRAVVEADKLLDDVLKRRSYKGKTTGERLVHAQHKLSNNESVWFGHKLRNRIVQDDLKKISKQDTLEALSGFRQALKDLGALQDHKPQIAEDSNA